MRIYVGFDDTDTIDADRGTGKLVRWFERELPEGCRLWGVVRQQLLIDPRIPYTSHNSSACAVIEAPAPTMVDELIRRAVRHLETHALEGSDPGLCVATEESPALPALWAFGRRAAETVVSQQDAREAAQGSHLSGHGGTCDGIIGAAAAVGLTSKGWSGRLIEYEIPLRSFDPQVSVADLEGVGIGVVSVDRNASIPCPSDLVDNQGWLRPRLWGGAAALPVEPDGSGGWKSIGVKARARRTTERE